MFAAAAFHTPAMLWILGIFMIQFIATSMHTVADAVVTDVAEASGSRMMMLTAYVIVADLGAALGPLAAMAIGQNIGFDAVYMGSGIVLVLMSLLWMRRRPASQVSA